jgi:uncharacterized membrane protein YeaQ/YmgE (transglycosylase-associated protein family)
MDTLVVLLWWALIGLAVGLIARFLVPSGESLGILRTILLGIVGAFVGGLIYGALHGGPGGFVSFSAGAWQSWVFAILGAVLVLLLYTWWERRSRTKWW